ncbi:MAG TPA: serine hydrolase [Verrucomicrobiae bacterium]|jgi:CubicO group peptidase (beta-lactamase class C family)|nr:serine hydrolase [Verrucomicrobiae bacterium]
MKKTTSAILIILVMPILVLADPAPIDFGYVPVGTTNTITGNAWYGGSWNGSNIVMTSESFTGPDAEEFSTSPNYTGQTLYYGSSYPYAISFAPTSAGFASSPLTIYETPYPPFGSYTQPVQGTGIPADRPATGPIVPELAPLQVAMTNYLVSHQFEAGAIALMYDSRLVLREGYGWRDTNFTQVIHPDNLFRLASVSKMLTASAIQKLMDEGVISNGTLIYSYLGISPWGGVLGDARITNITVEELLNHSGGWDRDTSPVGDPPFDTIQISEDMGLNYPAAPTNVISWMFSKPLDFAPGTTNVYSNFGYQILGRIIEKASGMSYMDYIQHVLLPSSVLLNPIGFTNIIQARSRPRDLAPWEIWYADLPTLYQSAVDYPTNLQVRWADGGGYYESFDSFGGISASAIGLCYYLLNYWEGGDQRVFDEYYGWDYIFYGSLPATTTVLHQNISQSPTSTNGIEYALLFNERDSDPNDNEEADDAVLAASTNITSWPTNGGGEIQWQSHTVSVNKNAGSVTVNLARLGLATMPVKISYTTYPWTAGASNYTTTAGVVSFSANLTNQSVTVPILNDGIIEGPRTFLLELISASGGAWLGTNLSCIVNIIDTNAPPQFNGRPVLEPGGGFSLPINAAPGLILSLQVSSNLTTWQTIQTFTNLTNPSTVIDSTADQRQTSFYRLVNP